MPTSTSSFAADLDKLIQTHLGKPSRGDDFIGILNELNAAAERLATQADRYRFSDESEAAFRKRLAAPAGRPRATTDTD